MKRLFAGILVLLLLTGCASGKPEASTVQTVANTAAETTSVASEPAQEPMIVEKLREFSVGENCIGIKALGEDILAFYCEEDQTRLVIYAREDLQEKAQVQIDCIVDPNSSMVQVNETGVAYCCMEENQLIQLDSQLREVKRIDLPENMSGEPVLSGDLNFLYYSVAQEIRVLDLRGGYSRLLKIHDMAQQKLLKCAMDGSVLLWNVSDAEGDSYTGFISTETGETLGRTTSLYSFDSSNGFYLLQRSEGSICEIVFGGTEGEPSGLYIGSGTQRVVAVPESQVALTCSDKDKGMRLDTYDLVSGRKSASIVLEGQHRLVSVLGEGKLLWILTEQMLFCWDMSQSPVDETGVYTGEYHTYLSPDKEALTALQVDAQVMGSKYGLEVLVWKAAVENCGQYDLEVEYQTQAVRNGLRALENALSRYPEGFLEELIEQEEKIHVALVRSIDEVRDGDIFRKNGEPYLVIAIGDHTESTFHHLIARVFDTYIFGKSREFDDWEDINPDEFSYDYNYDDYLTREDSPWLVDENRVCVNSLAMSYPVEDRAAVFEYAMGYGNEGYFASPVMQAKLQKMCDAIREAFGWEDAEEAFPWEQYLITGEE